MRRNCVTSPLPPFSSPAPAAPETHASGAAARRLVEEQAQDEALWFKAQTATEAYLQLALRRLHAAVEAKS